MVFKNSDRRAPHGQPIGSVRLRKRNGVFQAEELQRQRCNWREPYHFMLAIPWPGFLLSIATSVSGAKMALSALWCRSIFRAPAAFLKVERLPCWVPSSSVFRRWDPSATRGPAPHQPAPS